MSHRVIRTELMRFAVVGVLSNVALYGVYVALTSLGMGHKLAMSLLYAIGVLQTFVFNKRWSFSHHGAAAAPFFRYVVVYGLGYALNFGALVVFVDIGGQPHRIVQAVMIVLIALLTFLSQKYWVFRPVVRWRGTLVDSVEHRS